MNRPEALDTSTNTPPPKPIAHEDLKRVYDMMNPQRFIGGIADGKPVLAHMSLSLPIVYSYPHPHNRRAMLDGRPEPYRYDEYLLGADGNYYYQRTHQLTRG